MTEHQSLPVSERSSDADAPAEACTSVREVVYLVGNPWPFCRECRRHVYVLEYTGKWRHF